MNRLGCAFVCSRCRETRSKLHVNNKQNCKVCGQPVVAVVLYEEHIEYDKSRPTHQRRGCVNCEEKDTCPDRRDKGSCTGWTREKQ